MLTYIGLVIAGIVIGFVGGVLVYRNNVDEFERQISELQSGFDRVNEELDEAYKEIGELKAKLSRKPNKAGSKTV